MGEYALTLQQMEYEMIEYSPECIVQNKRSKAPKLSMAKQRKKTAQKSVKAVHQKKAIAKKKRTTKKSVQKKKSLLLVTKLDDDDDDEKERSCSLSVVLSSTDYESSSYHYSDEKTCEDVVPMPIKQS